VLFCLINLWLLRRFGLLGAVASLLTDALIENDLRFQLALDYDRASWQELSLLHNKQLVDHNNDVPSYVHNLGVAAFGCDLSIRSIKLYKMSFDLGETLCASNGPFPSRSSPRPQKWE
jgi:hypothetical protein